MNRRVDELGRRDDWSGVRAVVAGFGVSGFAAADNLTHLGAAVIALDESPAGKEEKAELLGVLGADIRLGDGTTADLPDAVDLLVVSPGWKPSAPLIEQARARGIPVWGEVELAWRLRDPEHAAPWLAVTGTNGKTTTVQMLDSILRAAGLRSLAVGNVGLPIVEAVMDPTPYDVFAVELSSFQLHYTESMRAESAAVLNVAPDHLDWYTTAGSDVEAGMADYAADKGRIYRGVQQACVYNVADLETERLVREADVAEGARAIGFTLGMPVGRHGRSRRRPPGRPGLHRRAPVERGRAVHDRRPGQPGAAHRRQRAGGRRPGAGTRHLPGRGPRRAAWLPSRRPPDRDRRHHRPGHPRVTWVDDSKATNPHAALSSLLAFDPVVWIAGGLAKGARFDDLVVAARDRLRGVVLLGRDRDVIAGALARHAPDVPVIASTAARLTADMPPWSVRSWPLRTSPTRATRSSWPRGAPPWTCSRTTPTGATPSPRRCSARPTTDRRSRKGARGAMAIVSPLRARGSSRTGPSEGVTGPSQGPSQDTARARSGVSSWFAALRDALERPLTSYYLLLGASALLLTIGLIMVFSASSVYAFQNYGGDSYAVVVKQLTWVAIGLPCAWVAGRMPQRWIRRLAWPGYIASLGLLLLTAFFGVSRNGNTNWLALGPIQIQPSEIAKLALVLWAAHVYANKERRLGDLHQVMMPVVPGLLVATGLVVFGHDLGTALVLFAILLGMLWVVGAPARFFALSFLVVSVFAGALAAADPERLTRITTFTDPMRDYNSAGWQPAHGLFALSSGGLFGQGIGASQQKWGNLPAAHTDFIFAVLGEELGLVGTLLVIGLFLTIAYAAIRVARRTKDPFVRYMTFGIVVWIIGQMMINVGMVLALLPVIGIPMPLVSYGGSALVPSLVALGLLVGFARREPEAARALAQRKKVRNSGVTAGRVTKRDL